MTDVSAMVNDHLVEENRRLREALRDAREVADLLRRQASHHNDMAQEIRLLRRELQNILSITSMGGAGLMGPQGPKGEKGEAGRSFYDDYEVDNLGNIVKKKKKKVSKSF